MVSALAVVLGWVALCPARALSPESEAKILQGLDRMYSLDLSSAGALFSAVAEAEPEEPAGPLFLAGLAWVQYAQSFDVVKGGGPLQEEFLGRTAEAIRRGEARLKKDPRDAQALMWLGAAWGYRGRWKVLESSWISAARLGLKGYRYLQRAVKADPTLYDAYLGLGIYEYYSDAMPAVIRALKALVVKGNRAQGLARIATTLEKGKFSKTEAKLFLISIHMGQEKNYEAALALSRELRAEKPENLYFGIMELSALMHLRRALVTYLFLRRAQSLDLLGRRQEALELYSEVALREDYFDSVSKARAGLRKPVTDQELRNQLDE